MYHLIRQRINQPGWDDRTASHHRTIYAAQGRFIRDYRKLQAQAKNYYWHLVDDESNVLDHHLIAVFEDYYGTEEEAPVLFSIREKLELEREKN